MNIKTNERIDLFLDFPSQEIINAIWESSHAKGQIFAGGADNSGYYPPIDGNVYEDDVAGDTNWCVNLLIVDG